MFHRLRCALRVGLHCVSTLVLAHVLGRWWIKWRVAQSMILHVIWLKIPDGQGPIQKIKNGRTVVENGENRVPREVRDCKCSMFCVCTVNVRFIDRDICYVMVHTVFQPSFRVIGCDVRYLLVYDVFRQSFRSTF